MQKINWNKLSQTEKEDLIHQCRLGQVDAQIKMGDTTFIFIGGCVMMVTDGDEFVYPKGEKTKLWSEK